MDNIDNNQPSIVTDPQAKSSISYSNKKRRVLLGSSIAILFSFLLALFSSVIFLPFLLLSPFGTEQEQVAIQVFFGIILLLVSFVGSLFIFRYTTGTSWLKSFFISLILCVLTLIISYFVLIPSIVNVISGAIWRTPANAIGQEKKIFEDVKITNINLSLEIPSNCDFCRTDLKSLVLTFDFNAPFEGVYDFNIAGSLSPGKENFYFHNLDPLHPDGDYVTFLPKGTSKLTFIADPAYLFNNQISAKHDIILGVEATKGTPSNQKKPTYRLLSNEKIYTTGNIDWTDFHIQDVRIIVNSINLIKQIDGAQMGYFEVNVNVVKKGKFKFYGDGEILYKDKIVNSENQITTVPSEPVNFQFNQESILEAGTQKIVIPISYEKDQREMDYFYIKKFTFCSEIKCSDAEVFNINASTYY